MLEHSGNWPRIQEKIMLSLIWLGAILVASVLFSIIAYIVYKGAGSISWEFISENPSRMGKEGGILSTIIGTLYQHSPGGWSSPLS